MNLKKGFLMFLTNELHKSIIFHVKTMVCTSLFVNEGNEKNHRSHARSHDKRLNNKNIVSQCEQVNSFSRTYVRNYLHLLILISFFTTSPVFIFFALVCACILLFTCSHLNKINIKTITYHVNDFKNSFTSRSHRSHEG